MNLCIDQGNSSTKVGIFDQDKLIETFQFALGEKWDVTQLCGKHKVDACIMSSVVDVDNSFIVRLRDEFKTVIELTHTTRLPIKNNYKTPETLGKDRLAAVVGASYLQPDTDILVIDAGTAITYDFVDANKVYHGGNIAPGINLRLRSLNEFTRKLPLVEAKDDGPLLGYDTHSAINSGVLYGVVFEIDGYINTLMIKYPKLSTFLTGGSTFYFDTKLKNAIFAENNLVLIGLNRILQYNVQK